MLFRSAIKAPFGGGLLKKSCYLDLSIFLKHSKNYFNNNKELITAEVNYDYFNFNNCFYKSDEFKISFGKVVFCEGYKAQQNPFFKNLPFKLVKGEIMNIEHDALDLDVVLNKNGFLMPIGQNKFKVGATYEWNELNQEPSEKGKAQLLEKLTLIKEYDFKIIKHWAGVRPTTSDRRPLLGESTLQNNAYIFNGLGTKGVMIAPFYATQMVKFLFNETELDDEVSLKRISKIQ